MRPPALLEFGRSPREPHHQPARVYETDIGAYRKPILVLQSPGRRSRAMQKIGTWATRKIAGPSVDSCCAPYQAETRGASMNGFGFGLVFNFVFGSHVREPKWLDPC